MSELAEIPGANQLALPMSGLSLPPPANLSIPRADRVFVNRNLKLTEVDWLGFDMDYTLAIYNQQAMDTLSVEMTVGHMVRRGYPEFLTRVSYDYRFPIRGLLIDKRNGNILKMDRFKAIHKGYHGTEQLSRRVLKELYQDKRIRSGAARFHWIDTLFSLSEVTAYAAIVDALEQRRKRIDYGKLFEDVRESIDEAHRNGDVHGEVSSYPERYLVKDDALAMTLHKFRSAGKRLFLLTNSPLPYTDAVMNYLLGDSMPEYKSWRQYFDVIIVSAQKPLWFTEGRPIMERDGDVLRDVPGPLERGKVYEGGNLREFERRLNLRGSSVLYVGDHIYGDILRSKKDSAWRTAMIIQELDAELRAHEGCGPAMAQQRGLEEARENLEDELRFYQSRFRDLSRTKGRDAPLLRIAGAEDVLEAKQVSGAEKARFKRALDSVRLELKQIDREHRALQDDIDQAFHPYWGSLLKEHGEMSSFGVQVESYSDIYMRTVSCLRHYSPTQFFRSPHDLMPHEL